MAFKLLWMPGVLKAAGLKVAEFDGWQTRGHGDVGEVQGVLCHHTAGVRNGNMPSLNTIVHGRSDLPGPLANLGLGRDGTFYLIAAGRAFHAGAGNWKGITAGNSQMIGIEAENTGKPDDSPWPNVQLQAYQHGVAALLKHIGTSYEFCAAHKEYALPHGRKSDPDFNMASFREAVRTIMLPGAAPLPLIPKVDPGDKPLPTLRRGIAGQGAAVTRLQGLLGMAHPNGVFGPTTEATVRAFQRARGVVPDGIVGPKTWKLLDP